MDIFRTLKASNERLMTKIPKIIHQTFYKSELPAEIKENIEKLKRDNPGWEYRFYNDQDIEAFISKEYGKDYLALYKTINPQYGAAKADLFRYLLMYRVGGVYLDIKSSADRPFDDILLDGDEFILAGWPNETGQEYEGWGTARDFLHVEPSEYEQWHIICAPGHAYLKSVIERVVENIQTYDVWKFGTGADGIYRVTGPVAYTLAIQPIRTHFSSRYVRYHTELGLRYSFYEGLTHRNIHQSHYFHKTGPVIFVKGASQSRIVLHAALKRTEYLLAAIKRKLRNLVK